MTDMVLVTGKVERRLIRPVIHSLAVDLLARLKRGFCLIMDPLKATVSHGTLRQLQRLEEKLKSDAEEQAAVTQKLHELNELQSRVQELTRKRDQLQKRLRHMPTDPLTARVLKDVSVDGVHATTLPPEKQRDLVSMAVQRAQEDQLHWLLIAQRCTGLTAEIVDKGELRVCFETFYNGEYLEPFYLQLLFAGKNIEARWHTIPAFIPLTELINQCNQGEVQFSEMLSALHQYLECFIQRREQCFEFSQLYSEYLVEEDIASTQAYNVIQLVLSIPVGREERCELIVQLFYKNLQSRLPTRVRCSNPEHIPTDRSQIKHAFCTLPLAEAFQHLFLDQNIEQG